MDIKDIRKELKKKGKVIIRSVGTIRVYKRRGRKNLTDPTKMVSQKYLSIKASRPFLRELNKKK